MQSIVTGRRSNARQQPGAAAQPSPESEPKRGAASQPSPAHPACLASLASLFSLELNRLNRQTSDPDPDARMSISNLPSFFLPDKQALVLSSRFPKPFLPPQPHSKAASFSPEMSRFVRPSKYRHVYPSPAKKEASYENIKVSNNAWDTNLVVANGKYISINWQASGGGAFAILPTNRPGKLPDIYPLCRGHTAVVLDTAFSPFDDNFVASASDDGTVGLWKFNDSDFDQLDWTDKERERNGGVKDFQPLARISGGGRKVGQVAFHPSASNVLAAATGDHVIKLFDITNASSAPSSPSIALRGFTDSIQSLDFDWTGTTIIATCRDRKIRTFDPRQGENPVQVAESHGGVKGARVIWCGDKDRAISTGFSKMSDRQTFLWDTKNLSAGPLSELAIRVSLMLQVPCR